MKFIQLQSGFIAKDETKFKLPEVEKSFYKDQVIGKDYLNDTNTFYYHEDITKLFYKYSADNKLAKDLNFIKETIKAIKDAIDNKSFFKWLLMETKYAKLSNLHKNFLYDTLNYLASGIRDIEVAQWIKLIDYSSETNSVIVNIDDYFAKETKASLNSINSNLTYVIADWISKPNGFEDMLITMFIIFGERRYINDVSDKVY